MRARPPLLDFKANSTKNLFVVLIFNNQILSPRAILQLYGSKLALEHMSISELRTIFGTYNKRSWYRLTLDMKNISMARPSQLPNKFQVIRDCLEAFKPIGKAY